MATKLRLIAQSRAEAERIRTYLRWRLGNDVLLEAPKPGAKGDVLVYGLLDPQPVDDEWKLDRLPVFDEVPR